MSEQIINSCASAILRAIYELGREHPTQEKGFSMMEILNKLLPHQGVMREECNFYEVNKKLNELGDRGVLLESADHLWSFNPKRAIDASSLSWPKPRKGPDAPAAH